MKTRNLCISLFFLAALASAETLKELVARAPSQETAVINDWLHAHTVIGSSNTVVVTVRPARLVAIENKWLSILASNGVASNATVEVISAAFDSAFNSAGTVAAKQTIQNLKANLLVAVSMIQDLGGDVDHVTGIAAVTNTVPVPIYGPSLIEQNNIANAQGADIEGAQK